MLTSNAGDRTRVIWKSITMAWKRKHKMLSHLFLAMKEEKYLQNAAVYNLSVG